MLGLKKLLRVIRLYLLSLLFLIVRMVKSILGLRGKPGDKPMVSGLFSSVATSAPLPSHLTRILQYLQKLKTRRSCEVLQNLKFCSPLKSIRNFRKSWCLKHLGTSKSWIDYSLASLVKPNASKWEIRRPHMSYDWFNLQPSFRSFLSLETEGWLGRRTNQNRL